MKRYIFLILAISFLVIYTSCSKNTPTTPSETQNTGAITGKASIDGISDLTGISIMAEKVEGNIAYSIKRYISTKPSDRPKALSPLLASESNIGAVKTDSQGNFKIENLAPGNYTLYAIKSEYAKALKTNIEVRAGQITNIGEMKILASGNIAGKAILFDKPDFSSGIIVFINGTSYISITDDSGNYIIPKVPVGIYTLSAIKDGYNKSSSEQFQVLSGETTTVNITIKGEGSIKVQAQLSTSAIFGDSDIELYLDDGVLIRYAKRRDPIQTAYTIQEMYSIFSIEGDMPHIIDVRFQKPTIIN
ncbi:MAG: TonB-dependent receptor plug [Candidatus Roizmanbacteria bacterium GW2011_GWC2_41_7]|uniref:TonB-dependent receptor plug n=1 Tax=Candidatus Roizmanbacteria bacterium GW2011_GWC2_41_7 TaxID=1618487 RepID=A0A0G0ZIR5_9BACT|nr:MAG: TonB-dependent receptor plug [Candidatus Roizmanbacteria bacterium GW2011_GWC2_41_7]